MGEPRIWDDGTKPAAARTPVGLWRALEAVSALRSAQRALPGDDLGAACSQHALGVAESLPVLAVVVDAGAVLGSDAQGEVRRLDCCSVAGEGPDMFDQFVSRRGAAAEVGVEETVGRRGT